MCGALQPAPIYGVVVLQVADGRLRRGATFEPSALLVRQALELAGVDDLNARIGRTSEAQIHDRLPGLSPCVLPQDGGLLRLLFQV